MNRCPSGPTLPISTLLALMADTATAQATVDARRARMSSVLGRDLEAVPSGRGDLTEKQFEHLLMEARELYENELAWEELTDEESVAGGHLTELVFPGFLAFIEGLLNDEVPSDSLAPARPHPEVVEEVLLFLAERYLELTSELDAGADSERLVWARLMTFNLIDLVLYRLHDLGDEEREAIESHP